MGKVIAVSNLKGGVGKTTTVMNLSAGFVSQGKSVLCVDADAQHSLTISFGVSKPEELSVTLATIMLNIINGADFDPLCGIIHHSDGIDLLPTNDVLARLEPALVGLIARETVLRKYIEMVKQFYDYVIVDCAPSLDLLVVNALAAADEVIIPVMPRFLDAKGLELLLKTIATIQQQINTSLSISGILLSMVDKRANFTKDIITLIENTYGGRIRIFRESIPHSVRAVESSAQGVSIFSYDPNGKVAAAYAALTREVLSDVA